MVAAEEKSGSAGRGCMAATTNFGSWTYTNALGTGQVERWHHYALVWNSNGIPGLTGAVRRVAVYYDGKLNSGRWVDYNGEHSFPPLTNGQLSLIKIMVPKGYVALDELRVWSYQRLILI